MRARPGIAARGRAPLRTGDLDIEQRGSIDRIQAADDEGGALDAEQLDIGDGDRGEAVGRARGKGPDALAVAAACELRPNGPGLMELPDEGQACFVGEALHEPRHAREEARLGGVAAACAESSFRSFLVVCFVCSRGKEDGRPSDCLRVSPRRAERSVSRRARSSLRGGGAVA